MENMACGRGTINGLHCITCCGTAASCISLECNVLTSLIVYVVVFIIAVSLTVLLQLFEDM
jgi:hypothetical protein